MQSFLLLTLCVCTAVAVLNEQYTGYNYNSNNNKQQSQQSQHSQQSANSQSYPDGYRYNGPSHKYLPSATSTATTPDRDQSQSGYNYRRPSAAPQQSYLPPAAATSATQYWPPTTPTSNNAASSGGYQYERPQEQPARKYLPPIQSASGSSGANTARPSQSYNYQQHQQTAREPQQSYLPPSTTARPFSNIQHTAREPQQSYLPPTTTARPFNNFQHAAREPQQSYLPPSTTARPFSNFQYQQPQQQYLQPSSSPSGSQGQFSNHHQQQEVSRAPQQSYLPPSSFNYQQNFATSTVRPFRASSTARPNQGYNYQQQQIAREPQQSYLPPAQVSTTARPNQGYNYQQQQTAREPQQSYLPPTTSTTVRPFSSAQQPNGYQYQKPQRQPAQQYLPPTSSNSATSNQGYNYQQSQQQEVAREPQATYLPPAASTTRPFSSSAQQFSGYEYPQPQPTPTAASSTSGLNFEQPEIQHSEHYVPPTRVPTPSSNRFQQYQPPQSAQQEEQSVAPQQQQFTQTSSAFQRFNGPPPTAAAINALNTNAQPSFGHQNTATRPQRPTGHATIERLPTLNSGRGSRFPTFDTDQQQQYIPPSSQQESFTANSAQNYNGRPVFASLSQTSFSQTQSEEQSSSTAADFQLNPSSQFTDRFRQPASQIPTESEHQQSNGFIPSSQTQETDKTLAGSTLGTNFNLQQNRFGSQSSQQQTTNFATSGPSKSPSNTFTFESSSSNDVSPPASASPTTAEPIAGQNSGTESQHHSNNAFASLWPNQQTTILHQVQSDSFELQPYYTMESTVPPGGSYQGPTVQDSKLPPSQTLLNLEAPRQPHVVYGTPIGTPQSAFAQLQSARPAMQYLPPSRDFQPPYYYY